MAVCLYCYGELTVGEKDFHKRCSQKIFGTSCPPELPYTRENLTDLARQVIRSQTTLTGVQAKLSLDILKGGRNEVDRFTIVGLWGRYILKPPTERFAHLPELEDLTMHLAELARIRVVPHSLIRFADGELCYITRRIDRTTHGRYVPVDRASDRAQIQRFVRTDRQDHPEILCNPLAGSGQLLGSGRVFVDHRECRHASEELLAL